jgi:TRAP-type C4-dicarboxylate transport system permease small subunit
MFPTLYLLQYQRHPRHHRRLMLLLLESKLPEPRHQHYLALLLDCLMLLFCLLQ